MFKNPFSFDGRIRRTEYGITMIIYAVCYFLIRFNFLEGEHSSPGIGLVLLVPVLWFLWAQGAKRCHDISKNGWWQIIPFYPLWLIFTDGDAGPNEYGDDPKGRDYENFDPAAYTPPIMPPQPTPPAASQESLGINNDDI